MNRVENQKLNLTTAELPFGWVFGFQLGLLQTQSLINTGNIIINLAIVMLKVSHFDEIPIGDHQWLSDRDVIATQSQIDDNVLSIN